VYGKIKYEIVTDVNEVLKIRFLSERDFLVGYGLPEIFIYCKFDL